MTQRLPEGIEQAIDIRRQLEEARLRVKPCSWRGRDRYLCHTCSGGDRYQNSEHRGCVHIQRVDRYRTENFT